MSTVDYIESLKKADQPKIALVLGIGGQDGSYLAEKLLSENYQVYGMYRRTSTPNLNRIEHIRHKVNLIPGDITDYNSFHEALLWCKPAIVCNMADQDNVDWSFRAPCYQMDVTAKSVMQMLSCIHNFDPNIQFFQPVSATIFGNSPYPQNEDTKLQPLSPYACAKAAAYHICRYFREVHGLRVSTGIMFNHDSPRRGNEYLLHKICRESVAIKKGNPNCTHLKLGSIDTLVDIGHAQDYMDAVYRIMQLSYSDDFVVCTGSGVSILQIVTYVFDKLSITFDKLDATILFNRPGPMQTLIGNYSKLWAATNWSPTKSVFDVVDELLEKYDRTY